MSLLFVKRKIVADSFLCPESAFPSRGDEKLLSWQRMPAQQGRELCLMTPLSVFGYLQLRNQGRCRKRNVEASIEGVVPSKLTSTIAVRRGATTESL